jgi:hypothetical protein
MTKNSSRKSTDKASWATKSLEAIIGWGTLNGEAVVRKFSRYQRTTRHQNMRKDDTDRVITLYLTDLLRLSPLFRKLEKLRVLHLYGSMSTLPTQIGDLHELRVLRLRLQWAENSTIPDLENIEETRKARVLFMPFTNRTAQWGHATTPPENFTTRKVPVLENSPNRTLEVGDSKRNWAFRLLSLDC